VSESAARARGLDLAETVAGNAIESDTLQPNRPPSGDRHEAIARAAYARAEQRGFESGHELEDWLEAEREIIEKEGGGSVG
jgi:hypothetical protein